MLYLLWRVCIVLIRYFFFFVLGIEGSSRFEVNFYGSIVVFEEVFEVII